MLRPDAPRPPEAAAPSTIDADTGRAHGPALPPQDETSVEYPEPADRAERQHAPDAGNTSRRQAPDRTPTEEPDENREEPRGSTSPEPSPSPSSALPAAELPPAPSAPEPSAPAAPDVPDAPKPPATDPLVEYLSALIADTRSALEDAAATTPETPAVPSPAPLPSPEAPEPALPELPGDPESPEVPDVPDAPGVPETPEAPEIPERPSTGLPAPEQLDAYIASLMRDVARIAGDLIEEVEAEIPEPPSETPEPTVEPIPDPTVEPIPEPTVEPVETPTVPPAESLVPPAPSRSSVVDALETIRVDSASEDGVTSNMTLDPATTYWLEVSGVYEYMQSSPFYEPFLADAACSSWFGRWQDEHAYGFSDWELELVYWDGPPLTEEEWWEVWMGERDWPEPAFPAWTPAHARDDDPACSRTHVYTTSLQGTGDRIRFQVWDYYHANNRGELIVRIFDEPPGAAPEGQPLATPSETPRPWTTMTPTATPTPSAAATTPAGPAPFYDPAWLLWAYGEGATSSSTVDSRDPNGWRTKVLERNRKYHIEVAGTFSYNGTRIPDSSPVLPGTGHADAMCALTPTGWSSQTGAPKLEILVNGQPAAVQWKPQYWASDDTACSRTATYVAEIKALKDEDTRFTFRVADDTYDDNSGSLSVTMVLIRG